MGLGPDPVPTSLVSDDNDAGDMNPNHYSVASPADIDGNTKAVSQVYKGHLNFETEGSEFLWV